MKPLATPRRAATTSELYDAMRRQGRRMFGWQTPIGARVWARCEDRQVRRATVTSHADTFFSLPARVTVGGRTVTGFLTTDDDGVTFTANRDGRNAGLIRRPNQGLLDRASAIYRVGNDWHGGMASRGYRLMSRASVYLRRHSVAAWRLLDDEPTASQAALQALLAARYGATGKL